MTPVTRMAHPVQLRHTGVVKTTGEGYGPAGVDHHTRRAVARLLLERGPLPASELASELGLSAAGVRRHLDSMTAAGEARSRPEPVWSRRGRGRPARQWLLTQAGRARFGHSYDELAVEALRALREVGGERAIGEFARRRVSAVTAGVPTADRTDVVEAVHELATSLSTAGYAASVTPVAHGVQLCQHHCPIAHVAGEFPEICEAERQAFAEVLGTHVQRLATIAGGHEICTTHIPHHGTVTPRTTRVGTTLRKEPA